MQLCCWLKEEVFLLSCPSKRCSTSAMVCPIVPEVSNNLAFSRALGKCAQSCIRSCFRWVCSRWHKVKSYDIHLGVQSVSKSSIKLMDCASFVMLTVGDKQNLLRIQLALGILFPITVQEFWLFFTLFLVNIFFFQFEIRSYFYSPIYPVFREESNCTLDQCCCR